MGTLEGCNTLSRNPEREQTTQTLTIQQLKGAQWGQDGTEKLCDDIQIPSGVSRPIPSISGSLVIPRDGEYDKGTLEGK